LTESGYPERGATRLIFLMCGMALSSWAPLVSYAKARILANDQDLGLRLLCFGAGSMLSMPVMGTIVGRYGCKRLIQCSAAAIFLGLQAVSVAPSSTALVLSLFLFGASIGALDVVMNVQASLVERHSGENLMSGFHALYSVGGFTGASVMSGLLSLNVPPGAAALILSSCSPWCSCLQTRRCFRMATTERSEQRGWSGQAATSCSLRRWLSL
jgi:predicted MFS family arabinose efflux permease